MSEVRCVCGIQMEFEISPPPRTFICLCERRYVWADDAYVENPPCREAGCDQPALPHRNGYGETIFLCKEHDQARWRVVFEGAV